MSAFRKEDAMRSRRYGQFVRTGRLVLALLLLIPAGACSKKSTDSGTTAEEETNLGWAAFEANDIATARTHFTAAININFEYAEAVLGIGWVSTLEGNLRGAQTNLERAIYLGLDNFGANVGLAVVLRDRLDFTNSIVHARLVITSLPAYVFSHRTSVDWKDLRLIIAQCCYRLGGNYFSDAQAEVDILDPGNGLDPNDSGTWVVGGITYNTYGEALLKEIESLEAVIDP